MSLTTPEKIETLRRKLYVKAKAEPDFRFYQLYDKIYRPDILAHAYDLAQANDGAPGVDGETFEMIAAAGEEKWLAALAEELREKTYRPQPVRRVMIPKHGGGERPLGIPTIRDRVVQTAAKLVLEPIFEADIDMNRFLKYWRLHDLGQRLKAHVVVYADDLVILSRRHAKEAHEVLKDVMTRIGLTVNETKTKLREATSERFDFLGYTFGPYWDRRGKRYLGAGPSAKSRQRLKAKVHVLTLPGNVLPWRAVCDQLNSMLYGWQKYFSYGTLSQVYSDVNWYVANRVRHFLRRRHKVRSRGARLFATERGFDDRQVLKLGRRPQRGGTLHAFA